MERLKTEREKAVQHAEDLGYQVEVLRAKLHEARRTLASRPCLRQRRHRLPGRAVAAQRADPGRPAARRRRARAARGPRPDPALLQEQAEQAGPAARPSCTPRPSPAASSSTRSWPSAAPPSSRTSTRTSPGPSSCGPARESQARRLHGRVPGRGRAGAGRRPRRGRSGWPSEARQRLQRRGRGGPRARPSSCCAGPARTPSGC